MVETVTPEVEPDITTGSGEIGIGKYGATTASGTGLMPDKTAPDIS